ncbi:MAG TPA: hypothetical protein VF487_21275 [Chitinophagaceae bacterium]
MSRNFTPDQTLVDQLLLDDVSAFEELHHRYCYSLYLYCNSKLNSPEAAKKIVRDIFVSLWQTRHNLPLSFSISLHLYTEVRKSVIKSVNERLHDQATLTEVEQEIIPGFAVAQLQKARQPVRHYPINKASYSHSPAIKIKNDENLWWIRHRPQANLKGLRHAFHSMLHLW